jgi:hypothetical protein
MVDWKPLLDGRVDGLGITVGGARAGQSVDTLPLQDITQIMPNRLKGWRKRGQAAAFGAWDDEPEGAGTQESQLDKVRKHGGAIHLHGGSVACQVANGLIRKMWVRSPFLNGLPFSEEADIERLLGRARGIKREHGCVVRHYPERSFSVGWYSQENRLEHVALGVVDWASPIFGARELLREWLEAAHAGLDPGWEEPTDRTSSPWVRHARVVALLRAFGLGTPSTFAEGSFLEGKPLSAYPIAARTLRQVHKMSGMPETEPDVLSRLFWWLLIYRVQAEKLLQINAGWLHAGTLGVFTALQVTEDANEGVAASLEEVEALLVELIDPSGKQVTERELIERWDWPQVDLDELLMDEL